MDIATEIASSWRRTTVLIGVALAVSACSGENSLVLTTPNSPTTTATVNTPSTAEPTTVSAISTTTTSDVATVPSVAPTSPSTTLDDADEALVLRTVLDHDPWLTSDDDIEVEVIRLDVLSPSRCELWAGFPNIEDYDLMPVVLLDHTPIAVDRNDKDLAFVMQRCFLDNSLLPPADVAGTLVALLSSSVPPMTRADETDPDRPLGTNEVPWQPPAVTAVDNGFTVTFMSSGSFAEPREYRVTATLTATPDGAGNADVNYEFL